MTSGVTLEPAGEPEPIYLRRIFMRHLHTLDLVCVVVAVLCFVYTVPIH